MRLVSKIRDYYDGVIRTTANDKSTFFNREQDEFKFKLSIAPFEKLKTDDFEYDFFHHIVGFCGEMHPCIEIYKQSQYGYGSETNYAYSFDDIEKLIPLDAKSSLSTITKRYRQMNNHIRIMKNWLEQGVETSYWRNEQYSIKGDKRLKKIFTDKRIVYYDICNRCRWGKFSLYIHPILKDIQFYKVFDSYSCFQKIEHYLNNELIKPDEIDYVPTDKLKVQSHGFDKWSFRKMPKSKKSG